MAMGVVGLLVVGVGWASAAPSRWSTPGLLAGRTSSLQYPVAVRVDSSQSVASWASARGVFAAVAGSTGRFGPPQRLSATGLRHAVAHREPFAIIQDLASDARGDAIVVWNRITKISPASAFGGFLYASYRPAGGRFGSAHLIARHVGRAMVGMDGRGNATIAWAQTDGPGARSIDVVERASSGRYGPVGVLANGAVGFVSGIAVNHAGDAVVVWNSNEPGASGMGIMAATRERGGPFGSPVPLISPRPGAIVGSVGIDNAGQALIAWAGPNDAAKGQSFTHVSPLQTGATTAGPAQTLRAPGMRPTAIGDLNGLPLIDVNAAGDAIVTWGSTGHDRATESLVVARRAPGRPFGTGVTIGTLKSEGTFDSAIGPKGDAIVAWDNPRAPVRAALASSARSPFGHAVTLAPKSEDSAIPAAGIGPHARAITIWSDLPKSRLQYAIAR